MEAPGATTQFERVLIGAVTSSFFQTPDVLVLGGGGILGEAWMSALLAGLEDVTGFDSCRCQGYVGTSAGSIVAAALVAGVSPRARVGRLPEQPPAATGQGDGLTGGHWALRAGLAAGGALGGPVAALTLRSSAPAGALLRRAALSRVRTGSRSLADLGRTVEQMGARFDGRLRISAVELESGRRVMFGAPGAPGASVRQAVEASCAIPGVFRPVVVGGRSYVDGGAWSPTNMDAAEVRHGTRVLCLNPTGSLRPTRSAPLGALGPLSRSTAAMEGLVLGRRGARVTIASPDRDSAAAMGINLMSPRNRGRVAEAGFAQGRRLAGPS